MKKRKKRFKLLTFCGLKPSANAKRAQLGDAKYEKIMRIQKQTSRTANMEKKGVKVVSEGGVVEPSRKEAKETKEQSPSMFQKFLET